MGKKAIQGTLVNRLPVWAIGAASLWEHGETAGNHPRGSEISMCIHQLPPATEHCSLWGANPWNCGVPHAGAGHALAAVECGMPSSRAKMHVSGNGAHRDRKCHGDMGGDGDHCCWSGQGLTIAPNP